MRYLVLAAALFSLTGCGAAAPGIIAAATSGASLVHSLYQVGSDIVSAAAIACQDLPAAQAAEAGKPAASAVTTWVAPLCDHLSPSNPNFDAGSPAWIAKNLASVKPGPVTTFIPAGEPSPVIVNSSISVTPSLSWGTVLLYDRGRW